LHRCNEWNQSGAAQAMNDGPEHVTKTEARAGTTPHMARYVLVWGMLLTVIAFAIILIIWF
jgi:hypothetical protein